MVTERRFQYLLDRFAEGLLREDEARELASAAVESSRFGRKLILATAKVPEGRAVRAVLQDV